MFPLHFLSVPAWNFSRFTASSDILGVPGLVPPATISAGLGVKMDGWMDGSAEGIWCADFFSGTNQIYFDNKSLGINLVYCQNTALNQYFVSSLAEEPKEQPQVFAKRTMFNNKAKDEGGAGEGGGGVWWSEPLAGLGFGKNRLAGQSV